MEWAGRSWLPPLPTSPDARNRFTVVSYHVTSEEHSKRITYVRPHVLAWSARRRVLLREVLSYGADVICLQDVDHFHDWWQPKLTRAGYDCLYRQRRSDAFSYSEGVCTAYKRGVFRVFRTCEVDLNEAVSVAERDPPFPLSLVAQDNAGLIVHLQPVGEAAQTPLCVATTQLCTQEGLDLIRVLQLVYFTKRIEQENMSIQAPVILCADISADPLSSAYYVMRVGREPFRSDLPRRCPVPRVTEGARCAAIVEWDPPPDHIRAGIAGYEIAWRPRGERIVGFSMSMWLRTHEALRTTRVRKEKHDGQDEATAAASKYGDDDEDGGFVVQEWFQAYVYGIPSGIPLQFRVRAANARGFGPWSDMSDPFVTSGARKAPSRPETELFLRFDEMTELVAAERMMGEDNDAYATIQAHEINHALPQIHGGAVHRDMAPGRAYGGISDQVVRDKLPQQPQIPDDGTTSNSKRSLRDFLFREHDRMIQAQIAQKELEQQAYDNLYRNFDSGDDEVAPGARHPRHVHSLHLRSVYEDYDVTGEPAFTCTREGKLAVEDYLLYSADSLQVRHMMSFPPLWSLAAQHPAQRLHVQHPFQPEPPPFLRHKFAPDLQNGVDDHDQGLDARKLRARLDQWMDEHGGIVDGRWVEDWIPNPDRTSKVFPNEEFGSAHVALCAVFEVQADNTSSTLPR